MSQKGIFNVVAVQANIVTHLIARRLTIHVILNVLPNPAAVNDELMMVHVWVGCYG